MGTSVKEYGLIFCLLFCLTVITFAQSDRFEAGKVTEKVTSPTDSTQHYAVFLPGDYNESKQWPVIFVMDPRGRALLGIKLFREAANELGYILISSYNTMSDGPEKPNVDAVNAMINDVPQLFSVNPKRYYLAGFSGTAILSWSYGYQLKDNVAGVIGFGAAPRGFFLPVMFKMKGIAFSFFGGAAYYDFNYFEMLELDFKLDEYEYPHAEVFYDGEHGWPKPDIIRDALYWMELRAMKENIREVDTSIVNQYKSDQLLQAQNLEDEDKRYEAYRRYRIALEACNGLTDVNSLQDDVNRLKKLREVKRAPKKLKKHSKEVRESLAEAAEYFREVREFKSAPSVEEIMDELSLYSLIQNVQKDKDEFKARAYRVMLENIYVKASFYEPRFYLRSGKPKFALSMLKVADKLKPGAARNCYFFARTYAELDKIDDAFQALQCFKKSGFLTLEVLENDSSLIKLNEDPRMLELKKEITSTGEN